MLHLEFEFIHRLISDISVCNPIRARPLVVTYSHCLIRLIISSDFNCYQNNLFKVFPYVNHARIQNVLSEGFQLWRFFFFLMRGEMAFHWLADYAPTFNAGLVALLFLGGSDQYC